MYYFTKKRRVHKCSSFPRKRMSAPAKQKSATCPEKRFKTNKDITESFPSRKSHLLEESAFTRLRLTPLRRKVYNGLNGHTVRSPIVCDYRDYEQTVRSNRTSQASRPSQAFMDCAMWFLYASQLAPVVQIRED